MVEEQRECEAILTQLIAARGALDRVGLMVVEHYVEECMTTSDPEVAQRQVRRILGLVISRYSVPEPSDLAIPEPD